MTAATQAQFVKLCRDVIDRPQWLEDGRFARIADRLANVVELTRLLNEIFAERPRGHWVTLLRTAGVPAGAVASVAEALSSELVTARATIRDVMQAEVGAYRVVRTPARLHDTRPLSPAGAPMLGEHTRVVLSEVGGLSGADIDALIAAGIARQA
jgi:crotonobetainyl-CoA:carnitine CoA-transferase CaiB-like acyl-CoA transferase